MQPESTAQEFPSPDEGREDTWLASLLWNLMRWPLIGPILRHPLIRDYITPKEIKRFFRFATVGACGMVVDLSILNALVKLAGWPLLYANSVSFSAAVLNNFTWNRLWTFPESRTRPIRTQLPQFALVNIIGLFINNVVLLTVYHLIRGFIPDPWDYNLAKMFAIGVVLFWNFGANRLWTYRGL
ncbi:MAG TPA: GtrA family protein [Caldilineae bacterium]|jgi:putative flippase GtrA|nr:GtrA family protein [Caldilineae bacterium]